MSAFIVEPILGAGMIVPPDGYLQAIREVCDRYGVLFIADEVMTGAGRTGSFLRVGELGVLPGHDHHGQGHQRRLCAARRGPHP